MINELDIERAFFELGLTNRQATLYLILAALGRAQANQLARKSRIPRPSVYHLLSNLEKRGLVFTQKSRGATYFIPNDPESLLRSIDTEQENLDSRRELTKKLVRVLKPKFQRTHYSVPAVQFFDGNESVKAMLYDHLPRWFESMKSHDNTQWGFQDPSFVKLYLPWLKQYWATMPKDHKIKIFSHDEQIERDLRHTVRGRDIRPFGSEQMNGTLWVSGNYITLISSRKTPHYAFQIEDATFAENLRSIFRRLWNLTDKFQVR